MKNKLTRIAFTGIAILVLLTGMFFSGLIAILDDAPGFAILGSVAALGFATVIYGIGEIIILLRKNEKN